MKIATDFLASSILDHTKDMQELCKPLLMLGVDHFSYRELTPTGLLSWLTNDSRCIELWSENPETSFQYDGFISDYTKMEQPYLLEPMIKLPNYCITDTFSEECPLVAGISYVIWEKGIKKTYHFGSSHEKVFYNTLSNIEPLLKKFMLYFDLHSKSLLKKYVPYKIQDNTLLKNATYFSELAYPLIDCYQEFLKDINDQH